jgi:hypothetical protein
MRKGIEILINSIKNINNPVVIADKISHFVIDSLRDDTISLYEAYVINSEAVRFKRLGYMQPAWNERVRITICLSLLNQKLLSHIFNENESAEKIKVWGVEAYKLNKEKRSHYIMDRYNLFLDANSNPLLLTEMLEIRKNYDKLSDDDGPYHNEVFPYHFYSPEEILLGNKDNIVNNKNLKEEIEDLIVELNMK